MIANTITDYREAAERMLDSALRNFDDPHPEAVKFINAALNNGGCKRHTMLCTRVLAGISGVPYGSQESTYRNKLEQLDEALELESCWPQLRQTVNANWSDFRIAPEDCRAASSKVVNACAPSLGEATYTCSPKATGNAMMVESMHGIRQAGEHLSDSLASSLMQYSVTSMEYRPQYRNRTMERLLNRMEAIEQLDRTCAFVLHAPHRWKDACYTDQALTKLALWGDAANQYRAASPTPMVASGVASMLARRRIALNIEPWMIQNLVMTDEERSAVSEKAAYWLEVSQNLGPSNLAMHETMGLNPPPDLSENREYPAIC